MSPGLLQACRARWLGRALIIMHKQVFQQMCADLEHDAERWSVRLCDPAGDVIWRNVRQRHHYEPLGYVPSPTLKWEQCKAHFTPAELERVERVTQAAFEQHTPQVERVAFELNGQPLTEECTYLAAFGHRVRGVLAIHCRSVCLLLAAIGD